jgi:MATE family multidrug resistance protein
VNTHYQRELRAMVSLAGPVVAAELGWMLMGIVDTVMVGWLGPKAIGSVGIGHALFDAIGLFGIGLLAGLDTRISQSFGAGDEEGCSRWLDGGIVLAVGASLILGTLTWIATPLLGTFGINPDVAVDAAPYTRVLALSLLPLLLFSCLRRYLQATNVARPVMFAIITANVVNAAGNWILIPRMGVIGSAWSTLGARIGMFLFLAGFVALTRPLALRGFSIVWSRLANLLRLGLPSAVQITVEIAAFATATLLAGKLRIEELAAHQIALVLASTTYMVPLGISLAGAVRVGQAIGAGDFPDARRRGWIAIGLAASFMICSGLVMISFPHQILDWFTHDPAVHRTGARLLRLAALFQLFDGLQVSVTGVLRGGGDTVTPMYAHTAGYWVFGLPIGYWFCFSGNWGIEGIWLGLTIGLVVAGAALITLWWWRGHAEPSGVTGA